MSSSVPTRTGSRERTSLTKADFGQILDIGRKARQGLTQSCTRQLESEDGPDWRLRLVALVEDRRFDYFMATVILTNVAFMIIETNQNASCEAYPCTDTWLAVANWVLLVLYSVEVAVRFTAYRLTACCNTWQLLDTFVVAMGLLEAAMSSFAEVEGMPSTNGLKIIRVFRLVRVLKFVELFPALKNIIRGFASAMQAMMWGVAAICVMLLMFAIAAVELMDPIVQKIDFGLSQEWCTEAFSSVQLSIVFFFQTMLVGDNWGQCVVPISRHNLLFVFFFGLSVILVQLGLMNLILTAIVEEANKAHENDTESRNRELYELELKQVETLGPIFKDMDTDGSGEISASEFLDAYDNDMVMQQVFKLMNISRPNLVPLFKMMDADHSGTINYDEFLTAMRDAQLTDMRMQLMTIKLQNTHVLSHMAKVEERTRSRYPCVSPPIDVARSTISEMVEAGKHDQQAAADDLSSVPVRPGCGHTTVNCLSFNDVLCAIDQEVATFKESLTRRLAEPVLKSSRREGARSMHTVPSTQTGSSELLPSVEGIPTSSVTVCQVAPGSKEEISDDNPFLQGCPEFSSGLLTLRT